MTDKIRPPYEIALMHDHILRLEEELKAKEQECEELKEDLRKSFEEKDILHLIIDRLLEASGYDTNTASAEDFENVYEHMRYEQQQLDQLKAEKEELKNTIMQKCPQCGEVYLNPIGCELYEQLDQLKRQHQGDKGLITSTGKMNYQLLQEYDKLKTALTEIKEICKKGKKIHDDLIVSKEILQKISECEVE